MDKLKIVHACIKKYDCFILILIDFNLLNPVEGGKYMGKKQLHSGGFVPKYQLEKLAEKGNEEAKKTLLQMQQIEDKNKSHKK